MPQIIAPEAVKASILEKCAKEINEVLDKNNCLIKPLIRSNENGIFPDVIILEKPKQTESKLETNLGATS